MPTHKMNPIIAISTSVLLIAIVLPTNAFDDSLLLYLPFDNVAGGVATDLTGNTSGGKIIGGTKIVQGKRGRALELDGETGYVEIGLTPELIEAERDSFTAELWLMTATKAPKVPEAVVSGFHGHLIFGGHGPDGHNKGHWVDVLLFGHWRGRQVSICRSQCICGFGQRHTRRHSGKAETQRRRMAPYRGGTR